MDKTSVEPVIVPPTPTEQIIKSQLRIAIAAAGGALVGRAILPAGLLNDQVLDLLSGAAMVAIVAAWAWVRAKLSHSRFFAIAEDPRVPDAVARVAVKETPNA